MILPKKQKIEAKDQARAMVFYSLLLIIIKLKGILQRFKK
jgi:hypothetical protein